MRFIQLISLFISAPVMAVCWTATAPVKFCVAPAANATGYVWEVKGKVSTQYYNTTDPVSPPINPNFAELPIQVTATAQGSNASWPTELQSADFYVYQPFGSDFDGNSFTNAHDFTDPGWVAAFKLGCKSCADGKPPCGCK